MLLTTAITLPIIGAVLLMFVSNRDGSKDSLIRYAALAISLATFAVTLALTILILHIITGVMSTLHNELEDLAATDPLTGALNRRQMEASLRDAVERRTRSGAPASVLLIDIDHFKSINDRFGHDAGDKVLT